ncbi:MAG: family 16 glycoside hydrolase, partial [Verrucomicrobiota bacterium]
PKVQCWINGTEVFNVDLDDWPEVGKNPDGTPNKFKVAIKDKPRRGFIGFQNHGQVIWFRNIAVKKLD